MSASAIDFWANTYTAQAVNYQGVGDVKVGQFLLSLLLVIGLMLLLAWIIQRLGLVKKNTASVLEEERIIFYNKFNAEQTVVLIACGNNLRCVIYRGKQVEMATDLPEICLLNRSTGKKGTIGRGEEKSGERPLFFQEILLKSFGIKGKEK